jgi:hypothetical protein
MSRLKRSFCDCLYERKARERLRIQPISQSRNVAGTPPRVTRRDMTVPRCVGGEGPFPRLMLTCGVSDSGPFVAVSLEAPNEDPATFTFASHDAASARQLGSARCSDRVDIPEPGHRGFACASEEHAAAARWAAGSGEQHRRSARLRPIVASATSDARSGPRRDGSESSSSPRRVRSLRCG